MTIREAYEKLLDRELPDATGGNPNVSTVCFCHDDQHNSCSINVENGGWFCHATGNKGYLAQAIMEVRGVDQAAARALVKEWKVEEGTYTPKEQKEQPPIDARVRDTYIRNLNADTVRREQAQKKFGWNPDTVKRFGIGWSPETGRFTLPIEDEAGQIRNIRMYDPDSKGVNKMISWKSGYGSPARLYPIDQLKKKTIVICEGEKDCVLMNQYIDRFGPDDWGAVTGTGGAGTWRDAWNEKFQGKDVIIIYDRDQAGVANAQAVASKLVTHALSVKVITLDITEPADADITNYFQDSGKGWDDMALLIEETDQFTDTTQRQKVPRKVDDTVYEPHLSEASEDRYAHKRLKLRVMVAGKELAPFMVPRDVSYVCGMDYGKGCMSCSVRTRQGLLEHTFQPDDPVIVEMTRISKEGLDHFMRKHLHVNGKCPRVTTTVENHQNVEEVTLVPELEFSDISKEYVSRVGYVSEHGVQANRSYVMHGTTVPHPRSQHTVHFIHRVEPAQDNIDDFQMDDKKKKALEIFQPGTGQSVADKFDEISHDLVNNVTKIYGREDLIKAIDLCYHSVLSFNFQDKPVEKAWGDILVIGDTRTGKTETIHSLIYHYKLGEMSVGENTSFAGLVGGLKQGSNRQWSITWGRIPLNNRRLLVIDETSGLALETIQNMSGIRSNGVAEMVKIETQRTAARTRLVWLSNPRADKSMAQYGYGVEAVKELIGRPEDIARFDFVVTSATNEVPINVINMQHHVTVPHVFTSDLCRTLVLWAWSRKPENVIFSDAATKRVLELATEQSARYVSDGGIPLVEGGNHRIKLAKLAVAAEARTFSTDDGVRVLVEDQHAEFAAKFLDACYDKRSLDYSGWSAVRIAARRLDDKTKKKVIEWIAKYPDYAELWMTKDELRIDDFKTQFDMETKDARQKIIVPLTKQKMIDKGRHSAYVKTPAFIQILKDEIGDRLLNPPPAGSNGAGPGQVDDDDDDDDDDDGIPF